MTRLLCPKCGEAQPEHLCSADQREDWRQRIVKIQKARKPKQHFSEVVTDQGSKRTDIPVLLCDSCSQQIPDGTPAFAWTMWRGKEPEPWELEFEQ